MKKVKYIWLHLLCILSKILLHNRCHFTKSYCTLSNSYCTLCVPKHTILGPNAIRYLEKSSERVKVSELLKSRSVMFQRCRSWLLSDGVSARCSAVKQRNVQCSQMLNSWLKSLWKSGLSMNFDLVVSRLASNSATRLHVALVLWFVASSENCNDRQQTVNHI